MSARQPLAVASDVIARADTGAATAREAQRDQPEAAASVLHGGPSTATIAGGGRDGSDGGDSGSATGSTMYF